MKLKVRVTSGGTDEPPPPGMPVEIEVRDVTVADAASVTLAAVSGATDEIVEIDVPDDAATDPARDLTVYARIPVSGAPRVGSGDWITMRSFPVTTTVEGQQAAVVDVEVRRIS